MVTETTSPKGGADCPSVEEQLDKITQRIIEFDAQKLGDLKTELEAVKKKKEEGVKEYRAKFEGMKKQWCEQNDHIVGMRRDLIGAFPKWKILIEECVCKQLARKRKEENRLECRGPIRGRFEVNRDLALARKEAAKAAANGWESAAKTLQDQLNANGKLIDDLCKLACTPERPIALFRLWFKLIPAHARIRPVTECFTIPAEEMPDALCPPGKPVDGCRDCDRYEPPPPTNGDCVLKTPTPEADPDEAAATPPWPRGEPWLVPPDDYSTKIDCAYYDYQLAKDAYGIAERCFQTYADDLASVKKNLDALTKALDTVIEDCLKDHKDKGCCETEEEKKPPAEGCCNSTKGA